MIKNKYTILVNNTVLFVISNVLAKIILFCLLPLYTRVLSSSEYGVAELVTSMSELIIPICSFSIQDAVSLFCMENFVKKGTILKNGFVVMIPAVILLGIISCGFKLYAPLSAQTMYFFTISILSMTRLMLSYYMRAVNKVFIFALNSIVYNAALAGANIVFLLKIDKGLPGYFEAIISANIVSIVFLFLSGRIWYDLRNTKPDKKILSEMLTYSFPLILNSISWGLTHVADKAMLTEFCSSSETGIYSVASKIPSVMSLITAGFTQAWTLSAVKNYNNENDNSFYEKIFTYIHIICLLFVLAVFLITNSFLTVFLGDNFVSSVKYVPVLLVSAVFLAYSNFFSPLYSAMKKSRNIMFSALGGAVINVILNVLLIPRIGVMGACLSTMISYIYIAIFRFVDCRKYIHMNLRQKAFFISLVVCFFTAICTSLNKFVYASTAVALIVILLIYRREITDLCHAVLKYARSYRK